MAHTVAVLQPLTTAGDLVDLAEASSWPLRQRGAALSPGRRGLRLRPAARGGRRLCRGRHLRADGRAPPDRGPAGRAGRADPRGHGLRRRRPGGRRRRRRPRRGGGLGGAAPRQGRRRARAPSTRSRPPAAAGPSPSSPSPTPRCANWPPRRRRRSGDFAGSSAKRGSLQARLPCVVVSRPRSPRRGWRSSRSFCFSQ